ncbi:ABC transporter ATP-binding protein [Culicoidibacter larvae]|uniref:ABC transporter ATP-binding protein n=1 Tax=Culicoidibacter larvae TaxID=2579976 RepID=A0A5R8QC94_9FIRM|nr:ABC transporter ATP-binding protein [Culicoidibacter larvae]TLG74191.1 ABC transporter ATP-binding protein [Culicoidibacter larvae]
MKTIVGYLRGFKKETILGPFFKWLEAVFELLQPLLMAQIIDVGIANNDTAFILRYGLYMAILAVVGYICSVICQYFAARASQGYGTVVRNSLFAHINRLSVGQVRQFGASSLTTRMTNDVNQLQLAVAMLIRLVVRAPFIIIGATVLAFFIDATTAIIFVVIIPLIVVVLYVVMSRSVPFYTVIQQKVDGLSRITRENLSGIRVIRAFAKQREAADKFIEASSDVRDTSIRVGKISAWLNPLTYLILNFGIIAVLWYGGMQVNIGNLAQGEVIALVSYMTQILLALIVVANLVIIFTRSYASSLRVAEVLNTPPSITEAGGVPDSVIKNSPEKVRFEQVSFGFDDAREPVLRDVNFSLDAGKTLGIIGGTGAGKSTLVQLLPRFFDVTQGAVLINGIDVREYQFAALRGLVNVIPQRAVVFTGTIAENLRFGNAAATDEELWQALEIAQARDFVERMEAGLDTMIYQGGKNLSGGQRQRLTIARALVSEPDILVFDDSSSALDVATDKALRSAIAEQLGGTTVIVVSQRINAIRHADSILVLEKGQVVAQGDHEQLLATSKVYREIAASQLPETEAV